VAVSRLASTGWIEADPPAGGPLPLAPGAYAAGRPALPPGEQCDTTARRPHIIMLLDESSFDVTAAPGVKVPPGYSDYFKSIDGNRRTLVAEATGGPTWYTEFNVLAGMSARSFGDLKFYVTRIAAGRVTRGLPQALQRCGYKTFSLYPTYGDFLGARTFQKGAGVGQFIDMAEMGVDEDMQPDKFYFDQPKVLRISSVAKPGARSQHSGSFSVDQRLSARSDAGLDAAGKYRGDRRIHSSPDHDGEGLPRFRHTAGARLSGSIVSGLAFRRSSTGHLAEIARARH
jgi:hypothetical protein